jgi:N-acetylgalactosamine kinase
VIETVGNRFHNVFFAYQDEPRGTGHAVKIAASLLEAMGFQGSVLVVAGDKVVQPSAINRLFQVFRKKNCDLAFITGPRKFAPDSGIVVFNSRGQVVADVEIKELRKAQEKNQPFRFGRGKTFTPREIGENFLDANLSVYMFKGEALFSGLKKLPPATTEREQYFTDIIQLLAADPARWTVEAVPIHDRTEVMAFNNPQELLEIQDVYRASIRKPRFQVGAESWPIALRTAEKWNATLVHPSAGIKRLFYQIYGAMPDTGRFLQIIRGFGEQFGTRRKFAIIRSPGRVNLMGRHIDHQGGETNIMAIDREVLMAVAPRDDDEINLFNANNREFFFRSFRISDEISRLDWDDWLSVINGPALQRMLVEARGDWGNYVKAAVFRLQEQFRDKKLCGLDIFVDGNIPMAAGLSSSSALVVAAAEATVAFNRLPIETQQLVDLCGEGEWFVGTRGGAADHAAIKLSQRGIVTHIGFFPFRIMKTAKFFGDCALIICNSGEPAQKSSGAKFIFNQKVTSYHIGRMLIKAAFPHYAAAIKHLRDVNPANLGCDLAEIYRIVATLPRRIRLPDLRKELKNASESDRTMIEQLVANQPDPRDGYPVRDVCLFGLAECERSKEAFRALEKNDPRGFGDLMYVSHDGDRVIDAQGRTYQGSPSESALQHLIHHAESSPLHLQPGGYACSTQTIDRIVDTVKKNSEVYGAQLAGAGLGGCAMILAKSTIAPFIVDQLTKRNFEADVMHPVQGACGLKDV